MHLARRMRSRAMHLEEIAGNVAENAFGQMAPAGIPRTQDQDGCLVHRLDVFCALAFRKNPASPSSVVSATQHSVT